MDCDLTTPGDWPRCKPWIEEALKANDFYTLAYIEAEIEAGRMLLWAGKNGCVLTETQTFPNGKALNVFGGGGEEHDALQEFVEVFDPTLTKWAAINNCRWIIIYGRPGWQRVGKSLGYEPVWNVIAKEVAQ